MRAINAFICKPHGGTRYKNVSDSGLILNTSEENHRYSNRYAEVVNTPKGYDTNIIPGDILLVHHNVFKFYNDTQGRRASSMSFFKDDIFLVYPDQYFMYKRGGEWNTVDRFCFVKPVSVMNTLNPGKNEPLHGEMVYENEYLREKGVSRGDIVTFTPDSEYEFNVDGEILYRVFDHQVTAVLCQ